MHFSHHKMVSFDFQTLISETDNPRDAGLGGTESPIKENGTGFVVPEEKEEWVVCVQFNGEESNLKTHLTPSASCGFCTLFV